MSMFNVILVNPEIPPNTGNIIRLCANTGCTLHLIEPLGFSLEDKHMRRAGLDYHEWVDVKRYADWQTFSAQAHDMRLFALTTKGKTSVFETQFQQGDGLVFGAETQGLPQALLTSFPESHRLRLPLQANQRSLNLSNAVAITVFEAWRQLGFVSAIW